MKNANKIKVDNFPIPRETTFAMRDKDVRMMYRKKYNQAEIARYMGISRVTVRKILTTKTGKHAR